MDASFLMRERSFSLLYFTGDVYEHIPAFLESCGYEIVGQKLLTAAFSEIADLADQHKLPHDGIVYKAAYRVPGGTVLLDPEMVVGTNSRDDKIVGFCTVHHVETFVAIWERFSETAITRHIKSDGVRASTVIQKNVVVADAGRNSSPKIVGSSGPKALLIEAGASLNAIFGMVSACLFTLASRG